MYDGGMRVDCTVMETMGYCRMVIGTLYREATSRVCLDTQVCGEKMSNVLYLHKKFANETNSPIVHKLQK